MKDGAGPGDKGPAPEPGRWDGESGDSTGFSRRGSTRGRNLFLVIYFTLPTATAPRLSSTATQAPELRSDWRFR